MSKGRMLRRGIFGEWGIFGWSVGYALGKRRWGWEEKLKWVVCIRTWNLGVGVGKRIFR